MTLSCLILAAVQTLAPNGDADMTKAVLDAVRELNAKDGGELRLAPGEYHFRSPAKRGWYVSNHDNDLPRDVFLPLEGLTNVTIVSPRAEFVCHGNGIAVGIIGSRNVALKGIGVDYSRPFNSEWHFVAFEDGMPILETDPAKFPFSTEGGVLRTAGECHHIEERLAVIFGGDDHEMICTDWFSGKCERLSDSRIKLLTRLDKWRYTVRPEVADTVFVTRGAYRPDPAVFVSRTGELLLEDVIVRAAPGMGIICQLSEDITIRGSKTADDRTAGAMARKGRLTPLQADATHFSNCRGKVTVENCMFERMCDDAINVHSTCLKIDRLLPPNRLVAKFIHKQAKGFELFAPGETVRFIKAQTMETGAEILVKSARLADPDTYEIELDGSLPEGYAAGDTIENADWQPEVRFANNVVNRNISRATLFTTPRRVVCEGNRFVRVGGSAIKLSGDSMNWYETGGCRDAVIRGNVFENCLTRYCQAVIAIDPEIADPAKQVERYHRNIVIEDNLFETHDVPLLWTKSVSNLVWRNNRIVRNDKYKGLRRKPFHFEYSDGIMVDGVPAERHSEASVGPEHTLMMLVSGNEEVAGCENEINDIAEANGYFFFFGNAQGRLEKALWDGRWEVALLDETEATPELLKTIAERAPQLKVVVQTRKTKASDWPGFETVAVGEATGKARAEIWAKHFFKAAEGASSSASIANPVLPGFYSDPSTCVGPDGKYCLAASSLQFFPAIPLFESEDLVRWTLKGHAIETSGITPLGGELEFGGYFAPTIRYHDGTFYLVADNHSLDAAGEPLGPMIMTAKRLEGPWCAPKKMAVGSFGDPSIDFIGDTCYFSGTTGRAIKLAKYDPVNNVLLEMPREVWTGTGGTYPEGPHVFKRGEWYYLSMAEGGTEYGHSQVIARSRSPYGPYEGCPHNPVAGHHRLKAQHSGLQAVGHGDFVWGEDGKGFFVCHAVRPQFGKHHLLGRETIAAPFEWTADGWPLVNGGDPIPDVPVNLDNLPAVDWLWVRNPKTENYAFEGAAVSLKPSRVRLCDEESPTFVGTRQTAIEQDFAVTLAAAPDDGVAAGVVSYMGRTHHVALEISNEKGRCVAKVRYQLGKMRFVSDGIAVASFPVKLRIEARAEAIRYYAGDTLVGEADPRHISCETDSDSPYNGIVFGMFAEGPESAPAVRFDYDPKKILTVNR